MKGLRSLFLLAMVITVSASLAVPGVVSVVHAVTPEQCQFFAENGKVFVCHQTTSPKNPYVSVLVDIQACVEGHAQHAGDFVGFGDPLCQGNSCLAPGAACDATLPCCEGLACSNGSCR